MPPPHPPTYVVQRFESLCSSTSIILSVLAKAANTRVHEVEEIVYSANVGHKKFKKPRSTSRPVALHRWYFFTHSGGAWRL